MPVMAVYNENQHEQTGDYRSRPRWSAGKKMEAVLRLLRGESLEELSRELKVEAHRLAAWREDFLEGGKDALKGQRLDRSSDDRALRQAERKVGQLTMENEILYDAVIDRWGQLGPDIARGLRLRHDWGPQYRSGHFRGSIAWLGIADNASFLGEPETNGCAERWIRTLKEQCLWAELHDTIDQLRQAVSCLSTATTTRG